MQVCQRALRIFCQTGTRFMLFQYRIHNAAVAKTCALHFRETKCFSCEQNAPTILMPSNVLPCIKMKWQCTDEASFPPARL
jgi:hypothetical protein